MHTVHLPRSPERLIFAGVAIIAFTCWTGFAFGLGYIAATDSTPPAVCPQVQGGTVLQTIDSKDGQVCVYISDKKPNQKRVRVTL
jgi:hypothetical protein